VSIRLWVTKVGLWQTVANVKKKNTKNLSVCEFKKFKNCVSRNPRNLKKAPIQGLIKINKVYVFLIRDIKIFDNFILHFCISLNKIYKVTTKFKKKIEIAF